MDMAESTFSAWARAAVSWACIRSMLRQVWWSSSFSHSVMTEGPSGAGHQFLDCGCDVSSVGLGQTGVVGGEDEAARPVGEGDLGEFLGPLARRAAEGGPPRGCGMPRGVGGAAYLARLAPCGHRGVVDVTVHLRQLMQAVLEVLHRGQPAAR